MEMPCCSCALDIHVFVHRELGRIGVSRQLLLDDTCGCASCRANTTCKPYQQLFADAQWLLLIEAFLAELYRLNSLPPESQLTIHMQVRAVCCKALSDPCDWSLLLCTYFCFNEPFLRIFPANVPGDCRFALRHELCSSACTQS